MASAGRFVLVAALLCIALAAAGSTSDAQPEAGVVKARALLQTAAAPANDEDDAMGTAPGVNDDAEDDGVPGEAPASDDDAPAPGGDDGGDDGADDAEAPGPVMDDDGADDGGDDIAPATSPDAATGVSDDESAPAPGAAARQAGGFGFAAATVGAGVSLLAALA